MVSGKNVSFSPNQWATQAPCTAAAVSFSSAPNRRLLCHAATNSWWGRPKMHAGMVWYVFIQFVWGKIHRKKPISPKQCVNTMKFLLYWLHPGGSKVVAYLVAFFGGTYSTAPKFLDLPYSTVFGAIILLQEGQNLVKRSRHGILCMLLRPWQAWVEMRVAAGSHFCGTRNIWWTSAMSCKAGNRRFVSLSVFHLARWKPQLHFSLQAHHFEHVFAKDAENCNLH